MFKNTLTDNSQNNQTANNNNIIRNVCVVQWQQEHDKTVDIKLSALDSFLEEPSSGTFKANTFDTFGG
jgi:hypothetical protein